MLNLRTERTSVCAAQRAGSRNVKFEASDARFGHELAAGVPRNPPSKLSQPTLAGEKQNVYFDVRSFVSEANFRGRCASALTNNVYRLIGSAFAVQVKNVRYRTRGVTENRHESRS